MPAAAPWAQAATVAVVVSLLAVSAAAWRFLLVRRARGLPPIDRAPRRSVPWSGIDVTAIFLLYYCGQFATFFLVPAEILAQRAAPPAAMDEAAIPGEDEPRVRHPVEELLVADRSAWPIFWTLLTAVIVAPLIEELLFRVVLQGWLEKRLAPELHLDHASDDGGWLPGALGMAGRALRPIVVSSAVFAAVHFNMRDEQDSPGPRAWLWMLATQSVTSLVLAGGIVAYLKLACKATADDLGWGGSATLGQTDEAWPTIVVSPNIEPGAASLSLGAQIKIGLIGLAAVFLPTYVLQTVAAAVAPPRIAADPIPLFFLAMAMGYVYQRTHRILPSLVLHAAFNALSMAMLLAMLLAGV